MNSSKNTRHQHVNQSVYVSWSTEIEFRATEYVPIDNYDAKPNARSHLSQLPSKLATAGRTSKEVQEVANA